jgi:hypothetical protein
MNEKEREFLKVIINVIGDNIDIDVNKVYKLFNLHYKHPLDNICKYKYNYDINKCHSLLNNEEQCSRKKSTNNFCLTHHKMKEKFMLDESKVISFNNNDIEIKINKMREVRKIPKLIECKYINIEQIDYLYDPFKNKVYDFEDFEFVGKLDMFNQLKKIENI